MTKRCASSADAMSATWWISIFQKFTVKIQNELIACNSMLPILLLDSSYSLLYASLICFFVIMVLWVSIPQVNCFSQWHVSPICSLKCVPQHITDHTSWISVASAKSIRFPDNYKCICMPELRSHVGIPLIGHSCWAVTQFCFISQVTGEAYKNLCMMTKDRHRKGTFYVLLTVKFCLVNVVNEAKRLFIISLSCCL